MPRRKKIFGGSVQIGSNGNAFQENGHSSVILNIPKKEIKIEKELESCEANGSTCNEELESSCKANGSTCNGNGELNPHIKIEETDELAQENNAITKYKRKIKLGENKIKKELRRTSRIIIPPKLKFSIDPRVIPVKKNKRGRKPRTSADILKLNGGLKRGPGRPRKVITYPKWHLPSTNGQEETPASEKDANVWTLVPKSLVESEFFKSHIIKMHYPRQPSKPSIAAPRQSRSITCHDFPSNLPTDRQKLESLFNYQGLPIGRTGDLYQEPSENLQRAASTRPTVIYFRPVKDKAKTEQIPQKTPNNWKSRQNGYSFSCDDQNSSESIDNWNSLNGHGFSSERQNSSEPVANWILHDGHCFSSERQINRSFEKESTAYVETKLVKYSYGSENVSCDIQTIEGKIADVYREDQLFVEEYDGYCKMIRNPLSLNASSEIKGNYSEEKTVTLESVPFFQTNSRMKTDVDTLCRQVIVDSLKLLCDEEALS